MKTREELIQAFVDMREFIRDARKGEYGDRYENEELNGMLYAIGYLSACLYPDDTDGILNEINERIK